MQAHSLSNRAASPYSSLPGPTIPSIAEGPGLAHDAGNLLGALTLYCDLLRAPGVLRAEHRHYAEELGLLARRSSALIERLLGRETASLHPPETTPAAQHLYLLEPVLQHIAQPFTRVVLTLPADCTATLPFTDETLERIVLNLVRNAVAALSETRRADGLIEVTLNTTTRSIQLSVSDNGPGLPLTAALDSFTALRCTSASNHRGLGLSILDDLARRTGAALEIRARPGHGSAFLLTWPAGPEATHASYDLSGRIARAC